MTAPESGEGFGYLYNAAGQLTNVRNSSTGANLAVYHYDIHEK